MQGPLLNTVNSATPSHASAGHSSDKQPTITATTTTTLLVAGLILLFHPYRGVWHDSAIYAGQVLALLHPESFRQDLFFAYGSQASYTVFPRAIAWLVRTHELGSTFLWLTLVGLAAFVLASWQFLCRLLPATMRLPGLLALLLLPASYGTWGILSYAEPFLTGRTFGEPLVLASLAALVSRRHALALILWCVAAALHPLQALPAIAVAWAWAIQTDRRWLHLLWTLPILLGASLMVPQLQFLTDRMDALWYQQVWHRNLVVFYSHSGAVDWYYLLKDAFVVGVAAYHAQGILRRYLLAVLGATVLLLGTSLLLADLLHLAWPAALQLWRSHWLLHWSAMAMLPWLCLTLWRANHADWPRLMIFGSAVLLGLIPSAAHPLMPGLALLYLAWPWLIRHLSPPLQKGLALMAGSIAIAYLYPELRMLVPWGAMPNHVQWIDSMQQPRIPAAIALVITLLAVRAWKMASQPARLLCIPLLALVLVYAFIHWDQRSQLQRAFTSTFTDGNPFNVEIRTDEQVIWLGNLLPAWSVLQRPYYIQQQQLSGIVFNRETSIEGYRRRDLMNVADGQGKECRIVVLPKEPYVSCNPDDTAVRNACDRASGDLAYFILPYQLHTKWRGSWTPGDNGAGTYYLYACRDFPSATPASEVAAPT